MRQRQTWRFSQAVNCSQCDRLEFCLPANLPSEAMDELQGRVDRTEQLPTAAVLYEQGQPAGELFAVRSGSFKCVRESASGQGLITGFYLPGDLLGLAVLDRGQHPETAIALEAASVCRFDRSVMSQMRERHPGFADGLVRRLCRELEARERKLEPSAEARVAAFLLHWARRVTARDASTERRIPLPMTRTDIGDFLGLRVETVSRAVTALRRDGLIAADARGYSILDSAGLAGKAGLCGH